MPTLDELRSLFSKARDAERLAALDDGESLVSAEFTAAFAVADTDKTVLMRLVLLTERVLEKLPRDRAADPEEEMIAVKLAAREKLRELTGVGYPASGLVPEQVTNLPDFDGPPQIRVELRVPRVLADQVKAILGRKERDEGIHFNDEPSYTCPHCGKTSHHPVDVERKFCGACGRFEEALEGIE